MSDLPNWVEWFVDLEEKHKKMMRLFKYILRKNGGLAWPLLYGLMLFLSWKVVPFLVIFIVLGSILTIVAFLYPVTWEHYVKKRENEFISAKCAYRNTAVAIKISYFSFMEYLQEKGVWQTIREKTGDDKKLLEKQKELYDLIVNLQEATDNDSTT